MAGGGHGHGGSGGIGKFFSEAQQYKGTVQHERGLFIKLPEQGVQNFASAFSNIRKYVEDTVHPLLSAGKDVVWEGLNFKKNGWKAPLKGLAGGTINVLESVNRGIKGILDGGNAVYKNLVIDNINSVAANTTDNLKYVGGIGIGNTLKAVASAPAWIMDKWSHIWENYGSSAWLKSGSKKFANSGRELKTPRLVGGGSAKKDDHGHGGGDHH